MISLIRLNSAKWINYLFVLFAFLLPLNRGIENTILYLIFFLFLFVPDIKDRIKLLLKNSFFKAYVVFLVYNLIVILWTPDKAYGVYYVQKYIKYLTIFPIILTLDKKFLKYAITAFLSGIFVSEIISYGIFFHLWETAYNKANYGYYDPTPFMHHTLYSLFLGIGIIILVLKFIFDSNKIERIILSFFFITMSINIFVTGGRGGQLALFVSAFIMIFYYIYETKKYKLFLLTLLPIFLFFIAYHFSPIFHTRVDGAVRDLIALKNFNFCTSWGQRAGAWIVSFEIFKESPLIGLGFKEPLEFLHHLVNTPTFSNLKCMDAIYSHTHLHNEFLMQLTQTGLIGLLLYLNLWYQLIKIKIEDNFFKYIKISFILMFCIVSFAEPVFTTSWSMNLFLFFTSLIIYFDINNNAGEYIFTPSKPQTLKKR